jgi:hypothetical protein
MTNIASPEVPKKRDFWEDISQLMIAVGAVAALLIGSGNKWGFIVALCAQPAWYYTSYRNKQWGVFTVTIVYTISWGIGCYRTFVQV